MRYQAEPGNERIFIFLTPSQQSLVISHQSTVNNDSGEVY